MLDHVEAEDRLIFARQRRRNDVVNFGLERPAPVLTAAHVLDEYRIEIVHGDVGYLLQHDAGTEGVAATDFRGIGAAA